MDTPVTPSAVSRLTSPTSTECLISPGSGRRNGVSKPATAVIQSNDDEYEKRARRNRRRSKLLEMQQSHASGSPATPTDRRRSLTSVNAAQMADHYSNCIKLSAENKISSKNAFSLHLIEYMSEMLKRKELENFQVASSTIDASAKIYAGRVDAVHAETYKVLSGLGRGGDKPNEKESEQDVDAEEGNANEGQSKTKMKKTQKKKRIVTDLSKINRKHDRFNMDFQVDPLFRMMSASFDEGGTQGLLMNRLPCIDGSCVPCMDADTIVNLPDIEDKVLEMNRRKLVDISEIKEIILAADLKSKQICPEFANFKFMGWNASDDTFLKKQESPIAQHAFDDDAEPDDVPEEDDVFTDTMPHGLGDAFDRISENPDTTEQDDVFGDKISIQDGKEATRMAESSVSEIRHDKHGTVGNLIQVLASEPSDYSYFNKDLLQAWAGPTHWRLRPLPKDTSIAAQKDVKTKKPKKPPFRIDFEQEKNMEQIMKLSAATAKTKATVSKYSAKSKILPKQLKYDTDQMLRLFISYKVLVKRQEAISENIDEELENYNYENVNDGENFCPGSQDFDDDDDDDAGGVELSNGLDFTCNTSSTSGPMMNFSQMSSKDSLQINNTMVNGTMLTGDNLIAQPYKVAKLEIQYAKTAKRLDVKRVKAALWDILSKPENEEQMSADENTVNEDAPTDEKAKSTVSGNHSLTNMLEKLPDIVSRNTAKNLSVPIVFVCLLHLANDKTLDISSSDEMTDLYIKQG